ncbi:hypothetical protein OHB26_16385 [Nocardia sp. NBC_01503]|uniref:DUF7257 domain-containing protein n=1 Tax=Nocardia sp. NBC_01503 TaxID=2975997 RepID=UPI002E7C25C3|nr:hypothetical protein [Nocardia sp. NBC_01503]WTL35629.1 hypothetical protein OHB26_16385 [Nocardia sp. NBC_01503]
MTSPDKSVPAGAYTGTAGGNISALQAVTFESAQASVVSSISTAFAGAAGGSGSLNAATQHALNAATNAQSTAGNANSTANAAQGSTTANSTVISGLLAGQRAQDGGGSVFSDIFDRDTLGPDYLTIKVGPVADLVITNGEVGLAQQGDEGTGFVLAVNTARASKTDDQAVSAVMGSDRSSDLIGAILIARAAADLSSFVWSVSSRTQTSIGYGTYTGGNFHFTPWTTVSAPVHTGDTVTLDCVGSTYALLVNGAPVASATDPAKASPVGPSNRHFGFGSQYYWTGIRWSFSFNIAGLNIADLAAPTVSGTGWSLMCLSTSIGAPSGELRFPANTFDTQRVPASNVTIIDQGRGQIQVTKAGWYAISIAYNLTAVVINGPACDLWWAPTSAGPWAILRNGHNATNSVGNTAAAEIFTVYLPAGSLVCPGYSLNVNATITGPNTYFDGAFISY